MINDRAWVVWIMRVLHCSKISFTDRENMAAVRMRTMGSKYVFWCYFDYAEPILIIPNQIILNGKWQLSIQWCLVRQFCIGLGSNPIDITLINVHNRWQTI